MYVGACMLESMEDDRADFIVATQSGRQVKVETIMVSTPNLFQKLHVRFEL